MRVVYLCEFPTLLGGERSLLAYLDAARRGELEPAVVAPPEGRLAAELACRGIIHVPWERPKQIPPQLIETLRAWRPALVHGNALATTSSVLSIGYALGTPTVVHVRDVMRLSNAQVDRLNGVRQVIAVSQAVRTALVKQGVDGDRVRVIYNGIDVACEHPFEANQPFTFANDLASPVVDSNLRRWVACVGQIALRKGQDLFLSAAQKIAEHHSDVGFLVVGERYSQKEESVAFEAQLRATAAAPPLAGRVVFTGYREDVPRLLRGLSVLVVPSRQEPLSRVLLEGLAAGVPCVATAVGGVAEILSDPSLGLLVPADNAAALADAITRLLNDADLSAVCRRRGPERIREAFAMAQHLEAMRRLYHDMLQM